MSAMAAADPSPTEVPPWLKTLPLAPEYYPTLAEFQDPIAYILKIEKEASQYGICKIVPPLPPPPKKATAANLSRSFAARNPGDGGKAPTFTTRQQQIGFCPRRPRPLQRPVWQSGEHYTLQEFEAKAKQFERAQLRKAGRKGFSPLEVESLFWKACADKPFSVEYANDMRGSGFAPLGNGKRRREEEAGNVGETAWNMRGVSRSKGSLLRFMKEEIPGVTSPMVYVAMMFSWFAWHVEDHDLHSLNYLHMGAGKTWYGVPRDARLAFEEVVRVHGYGGEVNPLVTFATLGEKTTVMSPEVLISEGIPCCRLVQNAGEFVVTFPGAYHSGFSHGFNCGEASNIATPEWLKVAKEAAIRRASINHPPMVSHYQLLYELALSLCSRMPERASIEPRSSRLKDKMRGEGELMVKDIFVQNVIENNSLLSILLDEGSSCIVIPQDTFNSPSCSSAFTGSRVKVKPRLPFGLYSHQEATEPSRLLPSSDVILDRNEEIGPAIGLFSMKRNSLLLSQGRKLSSASCSKVGIDNFCSSTSDLQNSDIENESKLQHDGLLDQGLLSCVTCGILSFSCMAVIQPTEATARYLMSADCSYFNDQIIGSGEISDVDNNSKRKTCKFNLVIGSERNVQYKLHGDLVHYSTHSDQVPGQSFECESETTAPKGISALDLLASAYGDPSDSEEEAPDKMPVCAYENDLGDSLSNCDPNFEPRSVIALHNCHLGDSPNGETRLPLTKADHHNTGSVNDSLDFSGLASVSTLRKYQTKMVLFHESQIESQEALVPGCVGDAAKMATSSSLPKSKGDPRHSDCGELGDSCDTTGTTSISQSDMKMGNPRSDLADFSMLPSSRYESATPTGNAASTAHLCNYDPYVKDSTTPAVLNVDKDSSRMHVFCLEHAVSVERQLHALGGAHIMLLCHPDYPKMEAEAKLLAEELGINHDWNDIHFQKATEEDQKRIRSALEDEEAIPMNSDWAVKMGINLYYSANQSKSPLYSKQMPYNAVIYKAFGHDSPGSSPVKCGGLGRRTGRQKKIVVAGRWCGKVWMSNQVHPYLAHRDEVEEWEHEDRHGCIGTNRNARVETDTGHAIKAVLRKKNSSNDSTAVTRKSGRKRKRESRKPGGKKPRCTQLDSSDNVDDVPTMSSPQGGRVLRSSLIKHTARANHKEITSWRKVNLKDKLEGSSSSRLRKRLSKSEEAKTKSTSEKQIRSGKAKKVQKAQAKDLNSRDAEAEYPCDVEGCSMSFGTKQDLVLHKRNICPVKGCGKKFFSHKYLVQHRKVHMDDRPLKCPWKGCKMTFKWPWARTEHIRVHTGARPYVCREAGCGQTFRFVSDFSRHKRKTGHLGKKACR